MPGVPFYFSGFFAAGNRMLLGKKEKVLDGFLSSADLTFFEAQGHLNRSVLGKQLNLQVRSK